jgi:hypothetical protein
MLATEVHSQAPLSQTSEQKHLERHVIKYIQLVRILVNDING